MIGVGAGLGHYTTEGGYLYPGARTVQIDINPRGLWQGLRTADLHVRADAKAAAEAIVARMKARGVSRTGFRTNDMARQIAGDSPDCKEFPVQPNTVDPRKAMLELDQAIPKDWDIVVGAGHYFSMAMTHMKGRPAERITWSTSSAPSARAAGRHRHRRGAGRRQGDAGRGRRQPDDAHPGAGDGPPPGHPHADAIMNDGGYGAEVHKFRANGIDRPRRRSTAAAISPPWRRASACAARR